MVICNPDIPAYGLCLCYNFFDFHNIISAANESDYLLLSFLTEDFTENVIRKTKTEIRTIVPLGAEFSIYDNTIPDTTETIDMNTEINTVLLKPVPNIMAVMFGITISEEISKIPTNLIEAITVTLARTMKR